MCILLKLNYDSGGYLELRLTKGFFPPPGRTFCHWHYLESPVHGVNKKQINF
jgi:hypothetical protein